jgi:predicted metal-dependent hydrolase
VSRRHGTHSTHGNGWTPLKELITKDIFKAEVHAWAKRVGVEVKALHIRRMTRKWGNCSTAGGLTFNAELLFESAELRKKVIVHELLHLKVPNHGKVLRALLRVYLSSDDTTRVSNRTR